ncbi:hypothetical protein BDB00DRAFT_875189 [Zychaea mexicana]|uniref:uncharacterized protein n=1 Tax=Zychaea mexicana TaxID=64656 RepID=UPI0022FDC8E6|nr:uncharacterized protein BDB00DRAFT_875189 [Zychaea mexicana]KAI9490593.1 hypothetical protein BDB00DRAFT_875189 [Zychaea mexicana]
MAVAKESDEIAQHKYTEDDVRNLQEKLNCIDQEYNEGIVDDRSPQCSNWQDDPYEHPGQGVVADELSKIHNQLYMMLTRIEK